MILAVKPAILIKRYKRFLADIELENGEVTTIHCANTGAMTGCAEPGDTVWYSTSDNLKRKYPFSWEVTQTKKGDYICVNTQRANQLVEEALNAKVIKELAHYHQMKREVKYGNENSKVDFHLFNDDQVSCYLEVKSATLLSDKANQTASSGQGYFPDAVTLRGQKHLRELSSLSRNGQKTALLFAVLHSGIAHMSAAKHIDEQYAMLLSDAQKAGVKILAYKAKFTITDNTLEMTLQDPMTVTHPE